MVSFDVITLYPSIPLHTISDRWSTLEEHNNIPKELFIRILKFCMKKTRFFKFDGKFYRQLKEMPTGSPISPIVADIVMEELLDSTLKTMNGKPRLLTEYVDEIFAIIKKQDVDDILEKLNSYNCLIKFTKEVEEQNKLPYSDSIVIRIGSELNVY